MDGIMQCTMRVLECDELAAVVALRQCLHRHAEFSGEEQMTGQLLWQFLEQYTSLELHREQGWFYAVHRELAGECVAVRADLDAIVSESGVAYHGCGHDGHSAILAGLGLALEGRQLGKSICLIFQPAEETGIGAQQCMPILAREKITEIYGLHNIPGYPLGTLLLRSGTFACASEGCTITVTGQQSHAAYPEQGKNPVYLLSQVVLQLEGWIAAMQEQEPQLLLATVVQLHVGEKNFGIAAGKGSLSLTLRAERQEALEQLRRLLLTQVQLQCEQQGLDYAVEFQDRFPATTNDDAVYQRSLQAWVAANLPLEILAEPLRWSEDFGWYLQEIPGLFFGIGAGVSCPGLHTKAYRFPDELLESAIGALYKLLELN